MRSPIKIFKYLIGFFFLCQFGWATPELNQLQFEYVENLEPFEVFPCTHEKQSVGLFEWDVDCSIRGVKVKFWVHLAVQRYEKTNFGKNAYEVLYWVTNTQNRHRHSSTSLWIHNSEELNRMNRLVSSLGIEEDNASLRLTLSLSN